jgi:DNA-binding MarR family transcriptional regulator
MTQLLDDTEAAGYITRIQDATDRRARIVLLTEQGRAAVELCYTLLESIEREYASLLDDGDEYESLKRGLTRLLNTLTARP